MCVFTTTNQSNVLTWPDLSRRLQSLVVAFSEYQRPESIRPTFAIDSLPLRTCDDASERLLAAQNLTTALLNVVGSKADLHIQNQAQGSQELEHRAYHDHLSLTRTQHDLNWQSHGIPSVPLSHLGASRSKIHQNDYASMNATRPPEPSSCLCFKEELPHPFHHYYVGATTNKRMDAGIPRSKQQPRRRSPSIAIRTVRLDPQVETDRVELANATLEFNAATWRLYDRIMSHRLLLDDRGCKDTNDDPVDGDHGFSNVRNEPPVSILMIQRPPRSDSATMLDEGIFAMDL